MKNKKIIIGLVVFILVVIPVYFFLVKENSSGELVPGQKQLYTCGMHPQIISDKPGLCPICEMKLTPIKNNNQKSGERKILYYRNPMNPGVISEHPQKDEMGMDYVPVYDDEVSGEGIVTIDPKIQQNMNVKTALVESKKLSSRVTTNGVLLTDETKEYIANTRVDGWVEKLYVNYTGQLVQKGSKLMDIYSPMLVSAQQEFLIALSYQNSMSKNSLSDILNSSNELVKNSIRKLQLLNVSDSEIERLREKKEVKTYVTLYAQNSGTVLEKNIIEGQKIMAGEPLLKIANLSNLWLTADVYEYELSKVNLNSKTYINFNFLPGKTYEGKVTFIYPTIDPQTRTVKVRIDVNNTKGELKPSMFANVIIEGAEFDSTPVVPENAVIRGGKKDIVILDLGNGKFKPQKVKLGIYSDGYYQVLSGLQTGNKIVTSAQFMIDSESNLKAAINQFQTDTQDVKGETRDEKQNVENGKGKTGTVNEKKKDDNQEIKMDEHDHSTSIVHKGVIDVESIDKNTDGKLWECPMDWNVIADESGRCPVCNMKLKEYTIDEIKTNLTKYGYEYKK